MAGPGGVYLPPVVAELKSDLNQFARKIAEAKAILKAFAGTPTEARVGANITPFLAKMGEIKTIAAGMRVEIPVSAEIGGMLTKLAASGLLAKILWGGGSKGFMGGGFWGRGGGIGGGFGGGFGRGAAGLGSVGSLAGFGLEHLITSIVGIVGSMIGGAIGGGLVGMGMLGTMGVGMGSDMIVASSTMRDAGQLAKLYENVAKAQAVYGKGSRQAEIAQQQLNFAIKEMGGASAVGVAAEIRLAKAMADLNENFDHQTQKARAAFVNNLAMPMVEIANGYIPLVAAAAERNFGIIGIAIRPLFDFLAGPGHTIFQNLENVFARNLPFSVGIFVQSMELILKMIDRIAQRSDFGGFLPKMLAFVTRLNTTGFEGFMKQVNNLIDMFHTWMKFFGALGRVLVDVFKPAAGLGIAIAISLTKMLNQLDAWIKSAGGQSALRTIFQVHKDQVMALLQIIPPLISIFFKFYIAVAPTLTRLATLLINLVVRVLDFVNNMKGPVGMAAQMGLAVGLLAAKLGLLGPILRGVGGGFHLLGLAARGMMAVFRMMGMSSLLSMGLIGVAIIAAIVIGYLLITHWKQIQAIARQVWGYIGPYVKAVLALIGGAVRAFVAEAKKWWTAHKDEVMQVWGAIKAYLTVVVSIIVTFIRVQFALLVIVLKATWAIVSTVIRTAFSIIKTIVTVGLDLITGHWKRAWNDLKSGAMEILKNLLKLLKQFFGIDLIAIFKGLPTQMFNIGKAIVQGIIDGIKNMLGAIKSTLQGVVSTIKNIPVIGKLIGSPSPYFVMVGKAMGQGIMVGLDSTKAGAVGSLRNLSNSLRTVPFGTSRPGGARGGAGGGAGVTIHSRPTININGAAAGQNPVLLMRQLQTVLDKHSADLSKSLMSGVYQPGQGIT